MDKQDILKALVDAAPSISSPLFAQFLESLAISSTKEDSIDRQEAYHNDALDYFEKIVTAFIHRYSVFFVDPGSCCEAFRLAIAADKVQCHQQANKARKMRDEQPSNGL